MTCINLSCMLMSWVIEFRIYLEYNEVVMRKGRLCHYSVILVRPIIVYISFALILFIFRLRILVYQ